MIPVRDNQRFYSEIISLYGAREKGLYAEVGGYYDQPNAYNRLMSIVESAVAESTDMEVKMEQDKQKEIDALKNMGLNVVPKKR